MNNLLIVDDERSMREFLSEILQREGYSVHTAGRGRTALSLLEETSIDMAIIDYKMPDMDGIELLEKIKRRFPQVCVILMTAYGSEKTAVDAMKKGASYYLKKPFESVDEVKLVIRKEMNANQLQRENILLRRSLEERYSFHNIVGQADCMKDVFEIMSKVVNIDSTVLITGESGTGKELVASAIHYHSGRKDKPFVTVSCGALPENLLESELFGHVKGAFTGAVSSTQGLFELAHGGTFFLDEIGETPPAIQVKLLRVLQSKTFKRVGSTKEISADVRLIAATNKDLKEAVKQRMFREDLYYRLNVIPIHLPPLRERTGDIPLLVDHFVELYCHKMGIPKKRVSEEVYHLFNQFPWPGNVRQLENVIERIIALESSPVISKSSVPREIREYNSPIAPFIPPFQSSGVDLDKIIADIEKKYLREALEAAKGTKKDAAELLSISFRSFRYRLQKYNLEEKN